MRSAKLFIFTFVIFISIAICSNGQNRHLYKGQYHRGKSQPNISFKGITKNELITLYGTLGLATYNGDLSGTIGGHSFRPQGGAGAILRTKYFGKRLYLRADIRMFRLYSNDIHEDRNLNFRSTNWEFLALGQFELFPYEKLMRRRPLINPYVYAGIGLVTFDPWGQLGNGKWTQLRPLETEQVKYGNVAFTYTLGFGLKFRYSYKWNFMLEGGYRFTTTDYIDDVSHYAYPPASSYSNPKSAQMANKSGNPNLTGGRGSDKSNDGYAIFSASVTYTFTKFHKARAKTAKHLLRK